MLWKQITGRRLERLRLVFCADDNYVGGWNTYGKIVVANSLAAVPRSNAVRSLTARGERQGKNIGLQMVVVYSFAPHHDPNRQNCPGCLTLVIRCPIDFSICKHRSPASAERTVY